MQNSLFHTDCSQCAALCCMAFAFEASEQFAIDKQADTPCPHLGADHLCQIHDRRRQCGFGGCIRFDCLGAGQYVTQKLFSGQSWRDEPALAAPMAEAFRMMLRVRELQQLLVTAATLPLSAAQAAIRRQLYEELSPAQGWSAAQLETFDHDAASGRVHRFLRSLREHVKG